MSGAGPGDEAVTVSDLRVRYGEVEAVRGVSFTARAGEVTTVLGPNGAGKTSTIEVCEGFRRAAAGSVRVLGLDPATRQRELSRRMGVMLQEGGVYPAARVAETIRQYCTLYGRGADPGQLLAAVGLEDKANRTWKRLSGGEKQRLSIARALLRRPQLMVFDEATSSLDSLTEEGIVDTIRQVAAGGEAITVLIAHRLSTVLHADRIYVLERGRIVETGRHDELIELKGLYYAMWRQQIGERRALSAPKPLAGVEARPPTPHRHAPAPA